MPPRGSSRAAGAVVVVSGVTGTVVGSTALLEDVVELPCGSAVPGVTGSVEVVADGEPLVDAARGEVFVVSDPHPATTREASDTNPTPTDRFRRDKGRAGRIGATSGCCGSDVTLGWRTHPTTTRANGASPHLRTDEIWRRPTKHERALSTGDRALSDRGGGEI
ncbi:hypothetical protein GCM10022223_27520 [Kineosporia mesophila]|uniref:Uncharacterized protein n=1 Tax=Kineosporia mesophila TaxID=566012 RepID=A0ABP6ZHH5_9ACTN